jgi:hypothetical protein
MLEGVCPVESLVARAALQAETVVRQLWTAGSNVSALGSPFSLEGVDLKVPDAGPRRFLARFVLHDVLRAVRQCNLFICLREVGCIHCRWLRNHAASWLFLERCDGFSGVQGKYCLVSSFKKSTFCIMILEIRKSLFVYSILEDDTVYYFLEVF